MRSRLKRKTHTRTKGLTPTKSLLYGMVLSLNLFLWQPVWSIESDRSAPIEIQANSAKLSEAAQTATYHGNVELSQGTLHITCDQLTVFKTEEGVERVEAIGKPATYTQIMEADKPRINAEADKIIYLPNSERIRLSGSAKITQSGNIFEGQLIEYNIKQQVLMASGNDSTSDKTPKNNEPKQRVKMTLQPKSTTPPQPDN